MLPSWCVQSVEFFLKDESTTQMIKLAPSAFHSVASDYQQQQPHDHDCILSLHFSLATWQGSNTFIFRFPVPKARVCVCSPFGHSLSLWCNNERETICDPRLFIRMWRGGYNSFWPADGKSWWFYLLLTRASEFRIHRRAMIFKFTGKFRKE